MRRVLPVILFLLLLYAAHRIPYTALADSQSALSDYNKQYDLYRQNYASYVTSKNKWLTYRTMNSNQEALTNGKIFLKQRVTVVISYLNMLQQRAQESPGFTDMEKNLIFSKLNVEQVWLSDHLLKYDSAGTLKDLEQLSGQFEDRYTSIVQYVALQVAGEVMANKERVLNNLLLDIINRIDQKLPEVASSGQDITIVQRWLLQAKNKNELASGKQGDSVAILNSLKGVDPASQYSQALFNLTESNQYLSEAASYLNEAVKNITNQ